MRVNLESEDDALFVGTLYVGAPHSQPVKVIFDTGSEHLAITSALCNNHTAGNYQFVKEDNNLLRCADPFLRTIEQMDDVLGSGTA